MLLTKNSKMKKTDKANGTRTYNFSLPAIKTCPFAGECKKFCYANKGTFRWNNVRAKHEANFLTSKGSMFAKIIHDEIIKLRPTHIRIHDTGDFYSMEYAYRWILIANKFPKVKFYAYTKSHRYFEGNVLPKNFTLIKSFGGKDDGLIDVKKDRHARIFTPENIGESKGYCFASNNDHLALAKNKKIGLLLH